MVAFCFSVVSIYGSFLRHCLAAAGLSSQSLDIDGTTTISFWGPAASTKPPLVLIHGFGPHGVWQWRPQISFFSRHFSVYVPDLLFFGRSTTKSADRSEIFQAISIAKLMEKLGISRYELNPNSPTLLGRKPIRSSEINSESDLQLDSYACILKREFTQVLRSRHELRRISRVPNGGDVAGEGGEGGDR